MSVLAVLQQRDKKFNRISLEVLSAAQAIAQAIGTDVNSAVLGHDIQSAAEQAQSYSVEKVFTLDHPLLASYTPDGYTAALEALIRSLQPEVVIFPHTYQVRDYAPKLSARFEKWLVSDVVQIKTEPEGRLVFVRQLFQGKLNANVQASGFPAFVSVQAGAFRPAEPSDRKAQLENFAVSLEASQVRSRPEQPFREAQRSVNLNSAEIIVSVGRGIKEKDNMPLVEELAEVLGAELAASRPICDNGWLAMERQVGSSGQTVSPKLYVAVGISGAIQHLVGMKGSQTIIAINKDESAPIFEAADYAIVGDLFEIVPAVVQELKKVKA